MSSDPYDNYVQEDRTRLSRVLFRRDNKRETVSSPTKRFEFPKFNKQGCLCNNVEDQVVLIHRRYGGDKKQIDQQHYPGEDLLFTAGIQRDSQITNPTESERTRTCTTEGEHTTGYDVDAFSHSTAEDVEVEVQIYPSTSQQQTPDGRVLQPSPVYEVADHYTVAQAPVLTHNEKPPHPKEFPLKTRFGSLTNPQPPQAPTLSPIPQRSTRHAAQLPPTFQPSPTNSARISSTASSLSTNSSIPALPRAAPSITVVVKGLDFKRSSRRVVNDDDDEAGVNRPMPPSRFAMPSHVQQEQKSKIKSLRNMVRQESDRKLRDLPHSPGTEDMDDSLRSSASRLAAKQIEMLDFLMQKNDIDAISSAASSTDMEQAPRKPPPTQSPNAVRKLDYSFGVAQDPIAAAGAGPSSYLPSHMQSPSNRVLTPGGPTGLTNRSVNISSFESPASNLSSPAAVQSPAAVRSPGQYSTPPAHSADSSPAAVNVSYMPESQSKSPAKPLHLPSLKHQKKQNGSPPKQQQQAPTLDMVDYLMHERDAQYNTAGSVKSQDSGAPTEVVSNRNPLTATYNNPAFSIASSQTASEFSYETNSEVSLYAGGDRFGGVSQYAEPAQKSPSKPRRWEGNELAHDLPRETYRSEKRQVIIQELQSLREEEDKVLYHMPYGKDVAPPLPFHTDLKRSNASFQSYWRRVQTAKKKTNFDAMSTASSMSTVSESSDGEPSMYRQDCDIMQTTPEKKEQEQQRNHDPLHLGRLQQDEDNDDDGGWFG